MSHSGYLYLPMEVFVREYDSRLLIALMAIERGMEVIIGQKWLMERNIKSMPPGLWIFKTMTLRDAGVTKKARAAGHLVASIDEEVPGMAEGSGGLHWVSREAVSQCQRIFCVGEEHAKSLSAKWPEFKDRLEITGNPRWDYLRPELSGQYQEEAARLKNVHGPMILVNTNIGETNSAKYKNEKDATERYIRRGKLDPTSNSAMEQWQDYLRFEKDNFNAVISLVPALTSRFPKHTIVVRPHPAENIETYRNLFSSNKQVKVIFEGPAAAWILASDILIHTACTTGTEAYALGKPAISYEPKPNRWHSTLLARQLNMQATDESNVIGIAEKTLLDPGIWFSFREEKQPVFQRFFHAGSGSLSAENIVSICLNMLGEYQAKTGQLPGAWRTRFGFLPWWYLSMNNRRLFPSQTAHSVESKLLSIAQRLRHAVKPSVRSIGDRLYHVADSTGEPGKSR